jgi:hypothetical protein
MLDLMAISQMPGGAHGNACGVALDGPPRTAPQSPTSIAPPQERLSIEEEVHGFEPNA